MFHNIYKAKKILKRASFFFSRKHFTSVPNSGATRTSSTFQQAKPGWIYKRQSCQPTGTHPSPRFALAWGSAASWSSLSSTYKPTLCTHWSPTGITALQHWAVTRGSHWLVHRPPYSGTAIRKASTPCVAITTIPKQELVSLVTTKTLVIAATPGSGLVQQGTRMTPTRVETLQNTRQIMETDPLKP